jgi:uncharacterized protein YoxC
MPIAAFTWDDVGTLALAIFLIALGLALAWAFLRLGETFGRLSSLIRGTERELLPVINKVGGTVDRVNGQLDKLDKVTDSAVDAVESVDTAVRAVSHAVVRPVQRATGLAAGVTHAVSALKARRNWRDAVTTGKQAAARREADFAEEIRRR